MSSFTSSLTTLPPASSTTSYSRARVDSSYSPPQAGRTSLSSASSVSNAPTGSATRFIVTPTAVVQPATTGGKSNGMAIGLGISMGILGLIIATAVFFILRREKRIKRAKFEQRTSVIRTFAPGKDEHEMEQKA